MAKIKNNWKYQVLAIEFAYAVTENKKWYSQFQFWIINQSVSSTKWSYKTETDYMEKLLEDFWEIIGAGNLVYWHMWSTSKTEKSLSLFPLVSNDLNSIESDT